MLNIVGGLEWNEEGVGDNPKPGWYLGVRKYNFYDIYQDNRCSTCQDPLNEPKDKDCCQQSQAIISQQKSQQVKQGNNPAERERERERERESKIQFHHQARIIYLE
jgi:hypothetical protein